MTVSGDGVGCRDLMLSEDRQSVCVAEKREEYRRVKKAVVVPKKHGSKVHVRRAHLRRTQVNASVPNAGGHSGSLMAATAQLAGPVFECT